MGFWLNIQKVIQLDSNQTNFTFYFFSFSNKILVIKGRGFFFKYIITKLKECYYFVQTL